MHTRVLFLAGLLVAALALAGAQTIVVNGTKTAVKAVEQKGAVLAEAMPLAKALGASAAYDAASKTVKIVFGSKSTAVAAVMVTGKAYVAAATVAKNLGGAATYDKAKKIITITLSLPQSAVKGTTQLAGDQAMPGQAYTLGTTSPINFTLNSAEYTATRVRFSGTVFYPSREEKMLLLRFTLQNPQSVEQYVNWATVRFTVVDANNVNREYVADIGATSTQESLGMSLKPAQKVEAYTVVMLPAKGSTPKLMVLPNDGPVLRYDLRSVVKDLPMPFADPTDGASAVTEIPSQPGITLPLGRYDIALEKLEYSSAPFNEFELADDQRFLIISFALTNRTVTDQFFNWGTCEPQLELEDGSLAEWAMKDVFIGTSKRPVSMDIKPGQTLKIRYYFVVPNDTLPATITFAEVMDGAVGRTHSLRYDLTKIPAMQQKAAGAARPTSTTDTEEVPEEDEVSEEE